MASKKKVRKNIVKGIVVVNASFNNTIVTVTDVNDNTPVIVEPEETVVSVREELPAGKEVVRVRAIDTDEGNNATVTYSFVIGKFCFTQQLIHTAESNHTTLPALHCSVV